MELTAEKDMLDIFKKLPDSKIKDLYENKQYKFTPEILVLLKEEYINRNLSALSFESNITSNCDEDIKSLGSIEGFVGPVGIKKGTLVLVDEEVSKMKNIVVGANKANYHLINVNFSRDFDGVVGEFRNAVDGDMCPVCGKPLKMERGIEIGQIFKLGTQYSLPMTNKRSA